MGPMGADPAGFYARLEISPAAAPDVIAAAFRRKARVLHPDVVETGNAEAFMHMKEAYDVLGDAERRAAYDRAAQAVTTPGPVMRPAAMPATRGPRLSDLSLVLWVALGGLFCLAAVMAAVELADAPPPASPVAARPFVPSPPPARSRPAAPTRGLLPAADMATHYVHPAGGAAMLLRQEAGRDAYLPGGQLAAFTSVQALRLLPQHGLVEIPLVDGSNGFVDAARLAPGDRLAARRAYCAYHAGPTPGDGEVLGRHGSGTSRLQIENRASQPTVVKLRDASGRAAVSVFVAPGGAATVTGLPEASYRLEFASGELWSRACNGFAAGMRAQRFADYAQLSSLSPLVLPPTAFDGMPPEDISDAAFEHE
jgi:hypothetical protein